MIYFPVFLWKSVVLIPTEGSLQKWHQGCASGALFTLEHPIGFISSYSSATAVWLFLFQKAIICFLLYVQKLKINCKKKYKYLEKDKSTLGGRLKFIALNLTYFFCIKKRTQILRQIVLNVFKNCKQISALFILNSINAEIILNIRSQQV